MNSAVTALDAPSLRTKHVANKENLKSVSMTAGITFEITIILLTSLYNWYGDITKVCQANAEILETSCTTHVETALDLQTIVQ